LTGEKAMLTAIWVAAALGVWSPDADAFGPGDETISMPLQLAEKKKLTAQEKEAKKLLLEQKMMLLESYLSSNRVKAIENGNDQTAKDQLASVREQKSEARAALDAGRLEKAEPALDSAFKLMAATAASGTKDAKTEEAKAEKKYPKIRSRVESYLSGLKGLEQEQGEVQQDLFVSLAVQDKLALAEKAAKQNKYVKANGILEEAHDTAVRAIAEMRAGQTLFMSLSFSSPREESDHEARRHESYRLLLDIARQDQVGMTSGVVSAIGRFEKKSQKFEKMAEDFAADGNYNDAIPAMEEATRNLVRALQATGLPIPE
jgi:hypothetical protein